MLYAPQPRNHSCQFPTSSMRPLQNGVFSCASWTVPSSLVPFLSFAFLNDDLSAGVSSACLTIVAIRATMTPGVATFLVA